MSAAAKVNVPTNVKVKEVRHLHLQSQLVCLAWC